MRAQPRDPASPSSASIASDKDDDSLHYSVVCYPAMAIAIPAILSAQRGYAGAHTCE